MKTFFKENKKTLQIIFAILGFALITLIYFSPILEGKRIRQHDIEMYKGMSQEIKQYEEKTGEQSLWTNSMFGGMPAWNISVKQKTNLITPIHHILNFGFPHPIGAVFISMVGFFILLLVFKVNIGLSFIGALAFGFSSYMYIIIGAGHNSKAMAIAYMAPVLAGIILTYRGKYLWGGVLAALATALEIRAGHIQITYYLFFIIIAVVVAEFVRSLKEKQCPSFFKASAVLVVAALIGILTNVTTLYANYEYGKETMRGKPILAVDAQNQTQGLDRDYVTQWSYGIGETWSLMIPNVKGGASNYIGNDNKALQKAEPRFRSTIAQHNAYWGDQPGTSGPVYLGAIVMFLFVLALFVVKSNYKWALLVVTILSILLSWGKNFMPFTDFFLDFIPGYNKFRAVSMTLVIAQVTIPLLAFIGLAKVLEEPTIIKQRPYYLYISFALTGGLCLLFSLAPGLCFNFLSQGEAIQFREFTKGADGAIYATLREQLENVRQAIFQKDALRSFSLIMVAAIALFVFVKGKLKAFPLLTILAILIVVDMFPIDKRYLNKSNYISKKQYETPFLITAADKHIQEDQEQDFRVLNISKDVFNDASTSYFHKSIGGYHGAKLRRYQDLISGYIKPELETLRLQASQAQSELDIESALIDKKALNMLNTKYIIYNGNAKPIENPHRLGNAWIVNDIKSVSTPNQEFVALASTDIERQAIIHEEFNNELNGFSSKDTITGSIALTSYAPNELHYRFQSDNNELVIFSEIWTSKGWNLYIDGQKHPLLRANYLLRAAVVPSGQHEVTMRYEPKIWSIGKVISLITSLLIIIGVIVAIISSFKSTLRQHNA